MKKSIVLFFCALNLNAGPLDFETLSADFTQSVQSGEAMIKYTGNFKTTKNHAFWHYQSPNLKDIYFSLDRIVIIEPELEQAIMTKIQEAPNVAEILKNAKLKNGSYKAEFDGIEYFIKFDNDKLKSINYTDKLDNKIVLNFSNVDKNGKITNETFIPKIPQNFDIITQ